MSEKKVLKVITLGNAPEVKGGITSVISQIMEHDWSVENIEMKFIPTFKNGTALVKIITFVVAYIKLLMIICFRKPDVLHIHMSHDGSFTRKYLIHKLCEFFKISDIIHLHSSEFIRFYSNSSASKQDKIRALLTDCGCVVALGDEWERRIKQIAPQAKVCVMNNTIAIPAESSVQDTDEVNFLYLGVLVKRKGVMDLLKAVKHLDDEKLLQENKVTFNIGGTGDCEAELKQFVSENNLNNYVKFLGWVSGEAKKDILKANQILVLPSYNEGLPIAILEAISYAMPVVSTDVGSIAEAVKDGENGFLFEAGDIDALYEALKKVILSPQLRKEMSFKSRDLAENVFSDSKYFGQLEKIYRQLSM